MDLFFCTKHTTGVILCQISSQHFTRINLLDRYYTSPHLRDKQTEAEKLSNRFKVSLKDSNPGIWLLKFMILPTMLY